MVLAVDRVPKFTRVGLRDDAGKINGAEFLRGVVAALPYAINTVLTDDGMAFADLPRNRNGPTRRARGVSPAPPCGRQTSKRTVGGRKEWSEENLRCWRR